MRKSSVLARAQTRVGLTLVAFALALVMTCGNALGCSLTPTDTCAKSAGQGCASGTYFDGGIFGHRTSSPWPQEAWATMTSYNPAPVWTLSSSWVMLANKTYNGQYGNCTIANGCYAQVGWIHWDKCLYDPVTQQSDQCNGGVEHAFMEYPNSYAQDPGVYIYSTPRYASEKYDVRRSGSQYIMTWDNGASSTATPSSASWGPDAAEYFGELHDFQTPNKGSHAAGDIAHPVKFTGVSYKDEHGTSTWPNLIYHCGDTGACATTARTTTYQDLSNLGTGPADFQIWDNRCASD